MDASKTLAEFKKKIDPEIEKYFDKAIKEAGARDLFIADAIRYVKKTVLSGGKRIRPAFMYYGYLAGGGKDREKILKASVSIELVHTFLLIHDDIIDNDNLRHSLETVHYHYSKKGEKILGLKNGNHFGNSMGIIIGDMIGAMGNQIIYDSGFDPELIVKALYKLQSIVSMTAIGESNDILMGYRKKASRDEILKMYEYKTAKYTIEGPLHLGAILGGGDEKMLKVLSDYSIPIGVAFQIQDDILGIFESEKKLGKPVGSDIKEGKQTILVVKAEEKAGSSQKKFLKSVLGKKDLALKEIEDFRKIIIDTGSLEYAKKLSLKLINKGKKAIGNANIKKEAKEFLAGIADYMIQREL